MKTIGRTNPRHRIPAFLPVALLGLAALVAAPTGCSSDGGSGAFQTEFATAVQPPLPPGPLPTPGGGSEEPDAEREIVEADILHVHESTLYALSSYRGLFTIDLANPEGLEVLGHLPLPGDPIEMIVRDDHALALVDRVVRAPSVDGDDDASMLRSRLIVVDVSDPSAPRVEASLDIDGSIADSRLVGDILYVIATRRFWPYWPPGADGGPSVAITAFDIADTTRVTAVDQEDLGTVWGYLSLHVTDASAYVSRSSWISEESRYVTRVRYLDISDPGGDIEIGAEFTVDGWVRDRWQLSEHDGVFRIIAHQGLGNGTPSLATYEIRSPHEIVPLAVVPVEIPRPESLTAARFDGDRAYVVTFERIDPLFVFDLSDPSEPVQAGFLEMSGWLDYIEPRGDRLVALGHDDASWPPEPFVSLIDVTDPYTPILVDREGLGAGWIGEDRDDYRKVFRVLDDMNLILVPFQAEVPEGGLWRVEGRVQLLDLDLANDRIDLRGHVRQDSFPRRATTYAGDLLTVSNSEVLRVDIANRDDPLTVGHVVLARNVRDLAFFGDHVAQVATFGPDSGATVVVHRADDPTDVRPVSEVSLDVASAGLVFADGDRAWVLGRSFDSRDGIRLQGVDLTDPLHPIAGAVLDIPGRLYVREQGYPGGGTPPPGGWYGETDESVAVTRIDSSVLAVRRYRPDGGRDIAVVDWSNREDPRIASTISLEAMFEVHGATVAGAELRFGYREGTLGGDGFPVDRYFLARVDLSDPAAPEVRTPVNIPGRLVAMDGRLGLTLDFEWRESSVTASLCSIRVVGDEARLLDRMEVGDGFSHKTTTWRDRVLVSALQEIGDIDYQRILMDVRRRPNGSLELLAETDLTETGGGLLGLVDGTAFVSYHHYGLAFYDVSIDGEPALRGHAANRVRRFVGYGGRIYLVNGYRGVTIVE